MSLFVLTMGRKNYIIHVPLTCRKPDINVPHALWEHLKVAAV